MALDRFRTAIQALAEDPNRAYFGLYPYRVRGAIIENGLPSLELQSEIEGMPDLVRIPWLEHTAQFLWDGFKQGNDLNNDTRLLVGFIAGDPSKPVALPFFLSGMIGSVSTTTFGQYTQTVEGSHTTTTVGQSGSDGNITENATATGVGASGGSIIENAAASGTRSSGGNILMNATSSGQDTTGGNIRATARGEIRLNSANGTVTIIEQNGTINITANGNVNITSTGGNVVMNGGGRNVAREADTVELTSFSGTVIDPLSGTLQVTMTRGVGKITSGTSRVKVP